MKTSDLARWLRQHTRGDALKLRQVITGGTWGTDEDVAPIQEWTVGGDPEVLAQEIVAAALEDAKDTGGLSRYRLVMLAGDEVVARKEWEAFGERLTEKSGVAEPATPIGLVSQAQRHVEARERASLLKDEAYHRAMAHVATILERQLERADARTERMEARMAQLEQGRIEQVQLMEQMLSAQAERELLAKKLESDLSYRRAAWERFEPAVPLVINKLLGAKIAKEDDGAFDVLESFVLSLKKAQIDAFTAKADPVQMTNFVKLWDRIRERVEEREKKTAADEAAKPSSSSSSAGQA